MNIHVLLFNNIINIIKYLHEKQSILEKYNYITNIITIKYNLTYFPSYTQLVHNPDILGNRNMSTLIT